MMKALAFVTVLLALSTLSWGDRMGDFEKLHKACMEESHTTEAELKAFFDNGMKANEATDNIKCQMKCVMEKQGMLKGGLFDADAATKLMLEVPKFKDHQAEITKIVQECKNEKGATDCETAHKITMCFKENKGQIMA